ncbi:hypothetical protein KJJ36_13960 [Staphylococcus pseudoxylosus]|uniref:hypothetical protein n=1 Tax=Staphylococcus pseudoxylosus TaxID=2282419 RepID=UPI001F3DF772|nr:hypothetical protein [Staphylococcus pseudoxylosus]MCE5003472.1 hypothetical protein [Staphylococcus pseudoxylosus]
MNRKIKNYILYLLSVTILITFSFGIIFSKDVFAKDDDTYTPVMPEQVRIDSDQWASDKEKEAQKNGDEPAESGKNAALEDNSVWTIYSQFIMTTQENKKKKEEEKEEKKNPIHRAFDGQVAGIIGDGGITINVPYNKMNSLSNSIRGNETKEEKDNSGSQMASWASTYSSYGYIDTNSGQKQLNEATSKVSGAFKQLFGVIIAFSLVVNFVMNKILDWLVYALIDLNPLTLLGFGDVSISEDNKIAQAIKSVFDNMGLGDVFEKVQSIGFMIIALMFICGVIWALTRGDIRKAKTRSRKWLVRLFVSALGIPLLLFVTKDLGHTIKDLREQNSANDNIVSQYILNARGWAASSNLSPSGLEGYEFPNAKASDNYIDKDFDPVRSRKLIKGINNNTYSTLYPEKQGKSGFDLLNKWMDNESFDVNTYIGDINRADLNGKQLLPAFDGYKETFGKKGNEPKLSDIEYSMWSATQNYDKELRNVSSKNFKKDATVGVRDNNSFSTQSVVLLLQSSFDDNQAIFYANNLGPTGAQAGLKNITTVKTNWQAVTMPGDGTFGVIGSYFGLGGHAVSYSILTIASIMALLTVNLLEAVVRAGKNAWATLWHGDAYALLSLAGIVGAGFISVTIALNIANWFMDIIDWAAKVISGITGGGIPSGFIDILANLIMVVLSIVLGFGRKVGKTQYPPIKFAQSIPFQIAFDYDDKIKMLSGKDNADFKGVFSEFDHAFKNGGRANLQDLGNHGKAYGRATVGAAQGAGIGVGQSIRRKGGLKNFGIPDARKAAGDAIVGTKYGFNNAFEQPTKNAAVTTKEQLENRSASNEELDNSQANDRKGKQTSLNNVSIGDDGNGVEDGKNVDRNNLKGYEEASEERVNNSGHSRKSDRQSKDSMKNESSSMIKETAKEEATGAAVGFAAESAGVSKDTVDAASGASDVVSGAKQMNTMSKSERSKLPSQNKVSTEGKTNSAVENQETTTNSSNHRRKRSTDASQVTSTQTSRSRNVNSSSGSGSGRPRRNTNENIERNSRVNKNNSSQVGSNAPKRRRRATEQASSSSSSQTPVRKKQETKVNRSSSSNKSSNRPVKTETKQSTQTPSTKKENVRTKENKQTRTTKKTSTRRSRTSNFKEESNTENTYNRNIRRRKKK